jgi:hypothetical protein
MNRELERPAGSFEAVATGDYMHLLGWSDIRDLLRTVGVTNWFVQVKVKVKVSEN